MKWQLVDLIKSKILELAIQGKLVEQEKRIADKTLDNHIYAEDEAPLSESVDKLTL